MFERVELLLEEKINKLKDKTILVLGVGGVGSYTVETLIRNPIKKIIIIDADVVDITNLNRQLFTNQNNIGLKKVDELAKLGEPRILLDAQNQNQIGGTGTQIDEELLSLVSKKYRLWIAGGINSENVNHLILEFNPQLIDVSSSLEIEPGIKSEEKIKDFCQKFYNEKEN